MTVEPVYIESTKRWRYFSTNSLLAPAAEGFPVRDNRVIFSLPSVTNSHRVVEKNGSLQSKVYVTRPFLTTVQHEIYPGSGFVEISNDPVNFIDSVPDTSVRANQLQEAERVLGNQRVGLQRRVIHLGSTPTVKQINDLVNSGLTEIPLFPPKPSDYDTPEHVDLLTTESGYKRYVKGNRAATWSARESKDLTGKKVIIWDGAHASFVRELDISAITADDSKHLDVGDVETEVDSALSGIHANLGSFLPSEKSWVIVNIPGQFILEITDTKFSARLYNSGFSTVESRIEMDKATGDIDIDAGSNDVNIDGATVYINGTPQ